MACIVCTERQIASSSGTPPQKKSVSSLFPTNAYESDCSPYESYINLGKIGFGMDPFNEEDYKVVMICEYDLYEMPKEAVSSLLYSTSTNAWRILEDDKSMVSDYPYYYHSNNTYLNGFYYWLAELRKVVLAFDMGKDVFRKIPTPSSGWEHQCDLVVHNDRISLLYKRIGMIDVYELNVEESIWIKKNSVVLGIQGVMSSLGFWKDSDMLLVLCNEHTVLYNTTTRGVTNIGPRGRIDEFKALVYYESLVSLGGGITKYKGDRDSSLDAIWEFLGGASMQDIHQQFEELKL